MDTIRNDIRMGFRALLNRPLYTTIALFTLALGIGVTTTMLSLVNSVLLKPIPLPDSHQLVQLRYENQTGSRRESSFSYESFQKLQELPSPFQTLIFGAYDQAVYSRADRHIPLNMLIASANYFELYRVDAHLGRWFTESDLGKQRAVISYKSWVSDFDRDPAIIGKAVTLNNQVSTIVGVMPAGFSGSGYLTTDIWMPIGNLDRPGFVFGRLKAGLSIEAALNQADLMNRELNRLSDGGEDVWTIAMVSLLDNTTAGVKDALYILTLAVAAVFLIAVLNVINLNYSHFMNRTQELSVRVAVGATQSRLVRQLLTESMLLAISGGLIGLLVAAWSIEGIKLSNGMRIPRLHEVGIDQYTLIITMTLALIAALATALIPALSLANPGKLASAIKEAGRKNTGAIESQRVRRMLVAAEIAVAVVLLAGAGLLLRSYVAMINEEPGFSRDQVVAGHVWLPDNIGGKVRQMAHWNELLARIATHPEIETVAGTSTLPMSPTGIDFDVEYSFSGAAPSREGEEPRASTRAVTADYFSALEIPLLAGRPFDARDHKTSSPVVIVNQTLAERLWPGESPVGRELILPDWLGGARRIVAVSSDVRHRNLGADPKPEFFTPFAQQVYPGMTVVAKLRDQADTGKVLRFMVQQATELNVAAPMINAASMQDLTRNTAEPARLFLTLIGIFAAIAMVLASIGVYGVSDNMVSQRTNEIGIRMALGASPRVIRYWIMWNTFKPILAGGIIGVIVAIVVGEILSKLLYEVTAWDPLTFLMVPVILLMVGILASWIPVMRATQIHPQQALHYQ